MKTLIHLLLLLFVSLISYSQTTFEFFLNGAEDQVPGSMIVDANDNIYLSVNSDSTIKIIKLNNCGILIDSVSFNNFNGLSDLTELAIVSDSSFVGIGSYQNEEGYYLWFVKFNLSLNIIKESMIPYDYEVLGEASHILFNEFENIVVATAIYTGESDMFDVVLFELGPDGDVLKEKRFVDPWFNLPYDIIEDTINNRYKLFSLRPLGRFNPTLSNLDYSFNILEDTVLYPVIDEQNTAVWINDSTYILSGKKVQVENQTEYGVGILKMNSNDSILLSHFLSSVDSVQWPAVHDNLSLVNENNIFYATYLSEYIPNNFVEAPSWIVINNYDSQLNLNFQEIYGGDAFYIPHCVASTHDSGFVVASSRYDWKTQDMERDVYVLKVNKEGLIVRVEGEKTNYSNEVVVFPNPGKNAIHIETQYLQSVLKMFNLSGILELEQNLYSKSSVVKVNDLIPGAYVYQIYKNKKMVKQGLWIKN